MTTPKAIGYVRVSTAEQAAHGASLDAQTKAIEAYATLKGFEVSIMREEGESAGVPLQQRPVGAEVLSALARREAAHVIALKLDRLFRNCADALATSAQWDKARISLHIIDMGGNAIDTSSAMGRMFFTLAAGFAEMERNLCAERTRTALRHKKVTGQVYSHFTPYGFQRSGKSLLPDAAELEQVRSMQLARASGQSYHAIARCLNASAVATKRGGKWHAVTVASVLSIHEDTATEAHR